MRTGGIEFTVLVCALSWLLRLARINPFCSFLGQDNVLFGFMVRLVSLGGTIWHRFGELWAGTLFWEEFR